MKSIRESGGRWIRATHVEWVESYPVLSRPYHLEMPLVEEDVSVLMDYEPSDELAFCIPLGYPELQPDAIYRFEGYCKSALLLARQLLHFSDVAQCGVPVFIGVSENGLDIFRQYAERCQFPESHIVVLPSQLAESTGWHAKFDMLGSATVQSYLRQVHLDAGLDFYPPEGVLSICGELLKLWRSVEETQFVMRTEPVSAEWISPYPHPVARLDWGAECPFTLREEADFGVWERIASAFGSTPDWERAYWYGKGKIPFISGTVFGTSHCFWQDARKTEVLGVCRRVLHGHDDEPILAYFARELPLLQASVAYVGDIFLEFHQRLSFAAPDKDEAAFLEFWRNRYSYRVETL